MKVIYNLSPEDVITVGHNVAPDESIFPEYKVIGDGTTYARIDTLFVWCNNDTYLGEAAVYTNGKKRKCLLGFNVKGSYQEKRICKTILGLLKS